MRRTRQQQGAQGNNKAHKVTTKRTRQQQSAQGNNKAGVGVSAQSNKKKLLGREIDIYIKPIKTDVGVLDHNLNIP